MAWERQPQGLSWAEQKKLNKEKQKTRDKKEDRNRKIKSDDEWRERRIARQSKIRIKKQRRQEFLNRVRH